MDQNLIPAAKGTARRHRRIAIAVLILNALSAALFINTVRSPVYDDSRNILDVHRYAVEGVNLASIREHINPTGPGSFIWMAAGVHLFGNDELRGARAAALLSWLLFGGGIVVVARYSDSPDLLYAALLATLLFPHTMTASATVMTEGPALLFGVLGAIVWVACVSLARMTLRATGFVLLGGASMGLAVICRQYYVALLPAAAIVAVWRLRTRTEENLRPWTLKVMASLCIAATPALLLVLAWKGLASPGMASGAFFKHWRASVGLNLSRPLISIFEIAFYLIPLTFPAIFRLRSRLRWPTLICAMALGATAGYFRSSLLPPGPLRSLDKAARFLPHGEFAVVAILTAVMVYNAAAFLFVLWEERDCVIASPLAVFSMFAILAFVLEQLGIGGNLPFYDRYVLQIIPFLAILAFRVLPDLGAARLSALGLMGIASQVLLWRHAFAS